MFCTVCGKVYSACYCSDRVNINFVVNIPLTLQEEKVQTAVLWKGPLAQLCSKCHRAGLHFRIIYPFRADEGNIMITRCFECNNEASNSK